MNTHTSGEPIRPEDLLVVRQAAHRLAMTALDLVSRIDKIVPPAPFVSVLRRRVWAPETQAAHDRARSCGNPMDKHRELIRGKLLQVYVVRGIEHRWHHIAKVVRADQSSDWRTQAFRLMVEDGTIREQGARCWLSELDSQVLDDNGQFLPGKAHH